MLKNSLLPAKSALWTLLLLLCAVTVVSQAADRQNLPDNLTRIHQANQVPQEVTVGATAKLRAQEDYVRRYPFGIKFEEAEPAQYFYLVPANFGGTIFTAISGFIAWPVSASWNAYHGHTTRRDMIPPIHWAANTVGLAGAYLLGSPFWALEKIFWDFPIWLFGDEKTESVEETPDSSYPIGNSI